MYSYGQTYRLKPGSMLHQLTISIQIANQAYPYPPLLGCYRYTFTGLHHFEYPVGILTENQMTVLATCIAEILPSAVKLYIFLINQ